MTGQAAKIAVVLLNMGGPDSLDAVRPFLHNLFSDPAILPAPAFVRRPLAWWIAKRRAPRSAENYRAIGGRSPLGEITRAQAKALEAELGPGYAVTVAMRYWHPRAAEAARAVQASGARAIVALPLYPQFSRATSGSSLADMERALAEEGLDGLPREVIRSWEDFPPYVSALAACVREALEGLEGATVLFSAHGLPVKLIEGGDPYLGHVQATVAAVMTHLPGVPYRLAFQSRTGPVRWLEPSVADELAALAGQGVKRVVVVPVSFVSDHIETLHEIDVEYRELAESLGFEVFRRSPSLNTRPSFVRALAQLVRERSAALHPTSEPAVRP
ncbi:MAG: ferrochelatase [Deferrisomatales bacterium]|nr:ferrochelatase [Deferrisomatales bacterium]